MCKAAERFGMLSGLFSQNRGKNVAVELVKDPVCGMEVNPANACHTELGGKMYYFCRAGCKASFKKAYLKNASGTPIKVRKVSRKDAGCCS